MTKCALTPDLGWLGLAMLLVGVALMGVRQAPQRIGADCALHLQQADLILSGAIPYRDFIDTDPPLIAYLNVLPAALARMLGASPIPIFGDCVVALLLISAVEIHILLRQWRMSLTAVGRGLVLLAWIAAYFVVDWRGDAGQQEHLFVLLYMPYLFLRILRQRGGSVAAWFAILLGVQAGIGVSLKPYLLLLAVNVELVLLFATRRRRTLLKPENYAISGVVAIYLLHWLLVPTAMRDAFFGRWLPLISYGYGVYTVSYGEVARAIFTSPITFLGLAAALTAALLFTHGRAGLRHHLVALTALVDMAMVLIFLQQQSLSCRRIPLDVAGLLCVAMLLAEANWRWAVVGRRQSAAALGAWAGAGLVLAVVLAVWFAQRKAHGADPPDVAALREIVQESSRPRDRVLVVSTTADPAYPLLLQTGRQPGSRYLYSFPIAMLYAGAKPSLADHSLYRNPGVAPIEELQFLAELKTDVVRYQPRLIIIHNSPHCAGLRDGFNPFDYLIHAGWGDEVLEPYGELPGPEGWKVFARGQAGIKEKE